MDLSVKGSFGEIYKTRPSMSLEHGQEPGRFGFSCGRGAIQGRADLVT